MSSDENKISIDYMMFEMAFNPNSGDCTHEQTAYLDKCCGEILWIHENDADAEFNGFSAEDNRLMREEVAADPADYLEIPEISQKRHHAILQEFLDSDWSQDAVLQDAARIAYAKKPFIGAWIKAVDTDTERAYQNFRYEKIQQLAEIWLNSKGISFSWT